MQTYRVSFEMRYRGRLVRHEPWLCRSNSPTEAEEQAKKYHHQWYSSVNPAFTFANFKAELYVESPPTPALGAFEDEH